MAELLFTRVGVSEGEVPGAVNNARVKTLSLNSRRLKADVLRAIAVALGLPGTAALADVRQMIEGSLKEQGHVPRNVQVVLMDTDGSLQIKLLDVKGTFLETELVYVKVKR